MRIALDGIDRTQSKPLYEQLASVIRGAIREGHYKSGDRIESEREFMRAGNLSYRTVARAFKDLVQDRLLVRRVGSGTFVSETVEHSRSTRSTIGVINYSEDEFLINLLVGIRDECRRANSVPLPLYQGRGLDAEDRVLRELRDYGVAGVLVVPNLWVREHRELIRLIVRQKTVVLMDTYLPEISCDAVTVDNEAAAYRLARHLLGLGHERIVLLCHDVHYPYGTSIRHRIAGVTRALDEAGSDQNFEWLVQYPHVDLREDEEPVLRAFSEIMDRPRGQRPTAIMCGNDSVAALVQRLLRDRGVAVPQEMSVTGFDDLSYAREADPPLTTVTQPLERMGRHAARLLFDRLENPERQPVRVVLDTVLKVRGSTAAPAGHVGVSGHNVCEIRCDSDFPGG